MIATITFRVKTHSSNNDRHENHGAILPSIGARLTPSKWFVLVLEVRDLIVDSLESFNAGHLQEQVPFAIIKLRGSSGDYQINSSASRPITVPLSNHPPIFASFESSITSQSSFSGIVNSPLLVLGTMTSI